MTEEVKESTKEVKDVDKKDKENIQKDDKVVKQSLPESSEKVEEIRVIHLNTINSAIDTIQEIPSRYDILVKRAISIIKANVGLNAYLDIQKSKEKENKDAS